MGTARLSHIRGFSFNDECKNIVKWYCYLIRAGGLPRRWPEERKERKQSWKQAPASLALGETFEERLDN